MTFRNSYSLKTNILKYQGHFNVKFVKTLVLQKKKNILKVNCFLCILYRTYIIYYNYQINLITNNFSNRCYFNVK